MTSCICLSSVLVCLLSVKVTKLKQL